MPSGGKNKKKRARREAGSDTSSNIDSSEFMKEITNSPSDVNDLLRRIEESKAKGELKKEIKNAITTLMEEKEWIINENKQLEDKIRELKRELLEVKAERFDDIMNMQRNTKQQQQTTTTYSSIMRRIPEKEAPKPSQDNVIIIKETKQNNIGKCQNEAMKEIKELQKSANKMAISKIIKTKTGLLLSTPREDISKIIEDLKKLPALESEDIKVYESTKMNPTIVLNKVSNDTDSTTIVQTLCTMNEELKEMEDHMRFLFEMKNTNKPVKDIVMRVTATAYVKIMKMQRIFTDTEAVTFREKIFVKQCQRCFRFNPDHKTSECQERLCNICGKSGEHTCTGTKKCSNCTKHPNQNFQQNANHSPNSNQCPQYEMQFQRIQDRIRYIPELGNPGLPPVRMQT